MHSTNPLPVTLHALHVPEMQYHVVALLQANATQVMRAVMAELHAQLVIRDTTKLQWATEPVQCAQATTAHVVATRQEHATPVSRRATTAPCACHAASERTRRPATAMQPVLHAMLMLAAAHAAATRRVCVQLDLKAAMAASHAQHVLQASTRRLQVIALAPFVERMSRHVVATRQALVMQVMAETLAHHA